MANGAPDGPQTTRARPERAAAREEQPQITRTTLIVGRTRQCNAELACSPSANTRTHQGAPANTFAWTLWRRAGLSRFRRPTASSVARAVSLCGLCNLWFSLLQAHIEQYL